MAYSGIQFTFPIESLNKQSFILYEEMIINDDCVLIVL